MEKSFRSLKENIENAINPGNDTPAEESVDWDSVEISEDVTQEDSWTPAIAKLYFAQIIGQLEQEEGLEESDILEAIELYLEAMFDKDYYVSDDDKDVSGLAGTSEDPYIDDSGWKPKRGFRPNASGLTNAMQKFLNTIVRDAASKPPAYIYKSKVLDAVEYWENAAAKAMNKGIGWVSDYDKKTGLYYPRPDYGTIKKIWADLVEKDVGMVMTKQADKSFDKSIDAEISKQARTLASKAEKITAKDKQKASRALRGARGHKKTS